MIYVCLRSIILSEIELYQQNSFDIQIWNLAASIMTLIQKTSVTKATRINTQAPTSTQVNRESIKNVWKFPPQLASNLNKVKVIFERHRGKSPFMLSRYDLLNSDVVCVHSTL